MDFDELMDSDEAKRFIGGVGNYSGARYPIDAIMQFLRERGGSATKEEIEDGVMRGRFRDDTARTRADIRKSIKLHTVGSGSHLGKLKMDGDLVGLPEWTQAPKLAQN